MKENATWTITAFLLLGTMASFRNRKGAVHFVRAQFFIFLWASLWVALFSIFTFLSPPRGPQGHGVMPMGQSVLAWVVSLAAIPAWILFYSKHLKPRPKLESWVIRGLFVIFLALAFWDWLFA